MPPLKSLLGACAMAFTLGLHAQAPALPAQPAQGQPIRILVGFPPGGSTDTLARLLADKLAPVLRQSVVVENRPGGGGRIAAQALKASTDGHTYMVAPNATPVFQSLLYATDTLKFDVLKDFTAVAALASHPFALAVSQQTGAGNAREYAAWLKANPKQASFGTAGAGGQTHFTGIQLGKALGVEMQAIPYRGNGPLVTDLLGGQIPAGIMTAGDVLPHQRGGKVNVLGVFGDKRSPLMPDVPTLAEQGINVVTGDAWTGMWASAQAPRAQLERMQNGLKQVLALPEVREHMQRATLMPDFRPGREADDLLRKELAYWGPVIKASGFTAEQ